jgi:hypothetical protein
MELKCVNFIPICTIPTYGNVMKRSLVFAFLLTLIVAELFFVQSNTVQSNIGTEPTAHWMLDSTVTNGLPELNMNGNSQSAIYNLTGNNQWALIIGQFNGWTINQYPFLGYLWNGAQWISNQTIVNGLTTYPNDNNPTIGFNVTGDNTFDMIVGQWAGYNPTPSVQYSGPCWTGYKWNGSQWVVNSTVINGLPINGYFGGGKNFVTLGYNVLGDGKWALIVDNYGNTGYQGYEWNGTAWTVVHSLVNGLPANGDRIPNLCLVDNFANSNTWTMFVGFSSGGPPNGFMEGYQWTGSNWVLDDALTGGITGLLPWPNSPTVIYNMTGDENWVMLIGSDSSNPSQPDHYKGFHWSGILVPLSAAITPAADLVNIGQSVTFHSTVTGGRLPYNYKWCINGSAVLGANTNSWIFSPDTPGTFLVTLNVTDSTSNTIQSNTALIVADYPRQYTLTFDKTGIGTDFNGTVALIDGVSYNASQLPAVFNWDSFSTHTFTFQTPLIVGGNSTDQYHLAYISGLPTTTQDISNVTKTFRVTSVQTITGNYALQKALPITRVQGNCRGTTTGTTLTVNMTSTPVIGDVLIGIIGTVTNTGVPAMPTANFTQAGVTWYGVTGGGGGGTAPGDHGYHMELYVGKVWSTQADTTITVTLNSPAGLGATMDVCEYSGIGQVTEATTNGLQSTSPTLTTGTVDRTMNGELTVAGIFSEQYALANPTNGFTLLDGAYTNSIALAYLEKTNGAIGQDSSSITLPAVTKGYGCIATFQPALVQSNVTVTGEIISNGSLSFTASGPSGQIGFINASVPVGFNSSAITVLMDGAPVQSKINTDGANYFIYLTFHLSTHNIEIQYAASASALASPTPSPTSSSSSQTTSTTSPAATITPHATNAPTSTPETTAKPINPTATPHSTPPTLLDPAIYGAAIILAIVAALAGVLTIRRHKNK